MDSATATTWRTGPAAATTTVSTDVCHGDRRGSWHRLARHLVTLSVAPVGGYATRATGAGHRMRRSSHRDPSPGGVVVRKLLGGVLTAAAPLLLAVDPLADLRGDGAQTVQFGGDQTVEDEVEYPGHVSWGGFGEMGVVEASVRIAWV